jgi:hypothetical protein
MQLPINVPAPIRARKCLFCSKAIERYFEDGSTLSCGYTCTNCAGEKVIELTRRLTDDRALIQRMQQPDYKELVRSWMARCTEERVVIGHSNAEELQSKEYEDAVNYSLQDWQSGKLWKHLGKYIGISAPAMDDIRLEQMQIYDKEWKLLFRNLKEEFETTGRKSENIDDLRELWKKRLELALGRQEKADRKDLEIGSMKVVFSEIEKLKTTYGRLVNGEDLTTAMLHPNASKHLGADYVAHETIIRVKALSEFSKYLAKLSQSPENSQKMSGIKVFVSHSSHDAEVITEFVDRILVAGIGIEKETIFYTSGLRKPIRIGADFRESIREGIHDCKVFICLSSQKYKESQICIAELGAAWVLNRMIVPILVYEDQKILAYELIGGRQYMMIGDSVQLTSLKELLEAELKLTPRSQAGWMEDVMKFTKFLDKKKLDDQGKKSEGEASALKADNLDAGMGSVFLGIESVCRVPFSQAEDGFDFPVQLGSGEFMPTVISLRFRQVALEVIALFPWGGVCIETGINWSQAYSSKYSNSDESFIEVGVHDFDDDGTKELVFAWSKSPADLAVSILKYYPAGNQKAALRPENWKSFGPYSGQFQVEATKGELILPYGSQGLMRTIIWSESKEQFIDIGD